MRHTLHILAFGTALSLGLGTSAAFAQTPDQNSQMSQPDAGGPPMHRGHGPMSPDQQLEHLSRALTLTSDQQAQIKPLLEARRQQMIAAHSDQSMTREDRMSKFKALDDDTHSKIAAVLDDKQKAKFEKMAERREEHMHGNDAGHQPPVQ